MLFLPYLALYLLCGCLIIRFLLPGQRPLYRLWTGFCLGVLLMMWLPALLAFALAFSVTGHLLALIPLTLLTVCRLTCCGTKRQGSGCSPMRTPRTSGSSFGWRCR